MEKIITKSFARLMGRGVHRGFITHEELFKSLGKRNLSDTNLSEAFIHILNEKIFLVEKKSDFKALKKKDRPTKDEGKISEKSDDPIRMYLREIIRDLKNYELEIRIQDLEEKFSKDLSEDTFNQLKELKKLQNLN